MLRAALTACLIALTAPAATSAQEYPIVGAAALEILPGYETDTGYMMAARIRLNTGWKTYWRAPGGNGIPPQFTWGGSKNLSAVAFHWPAPNVFNDDGVRTIGYANELLLPIEVTAQKPGAPVALKGKVKFGVCEDICVPVEASFAITLDGSGAATPAIRAAIKRKPRTLPASAAQCAVRPTDGGLALTASVKVPGAKASQFVVVEYPDPDVWTEVGQTRKSGGQLITDATLYALGDGPLALDRSKLRLTVLGGSKVIEVRGCRAG